MEVRGIVFKDVRGGEVGAASEPPRTRRRLGTSGRVCFEVAIVEVHRRRHGVFGVHHRGDALWFWGSGFVKWFQHSVWSLGFEVWSFRF